MSNPLHNLAFPKYKFRFKQKDNKIQIFDEIRKKWFVCTPEEWVRQNLIKYLIEEYNYPKSLIAVEKGLKIAGRDFRFDVLVYSKEYNPLLIVECKAPEIRLGQKVFNQIWEYNYQINAPFFLITNGLGFVMGQVMKDSSVKYFEKPPSFEALLSLI